MAWRKALVGHARVGAGKRRGGKSAAHRANAVKGQHIERRDRDHGRNSQLAGHNLSSMWCCPARYPCTRMIAGRGSGWRHKTHCRMPATAAIPLGDVADERLIVRRPPHVVDAARPLATHGVRNAVRSLPGARKNPRLRRVIATRRALRAAQHGSATRHDWRAGAAEPARKPPW